MKRFLPAFLLLLLSATTVFAQQNPFLSTEPAEEAAPTETEQPQTPEPAARNVRTALNGPFFNSAFMQKIRKIQKNIQSTISQYIADYRTSGSVKTLFSFLLFSFVYGLLHVLGPGHRKIFLFTYFISRPSKWRQGMLAGFMTAVLHAVSAVVLVGGLYLLTSKALLTRFNNLTPVIEKISYGAIIAIGLYLLIHEIVQATGRTRRDSSQDSAGGRSPDTILFVLASGMIPCPGAATIMIFSIAVGAPQVGVFSVLAMSLGMATVLTFVPPAAILLNKRLAPIISKWRPETGERIHSAVSIIGAVVLVLFGLLFII